MHKFIFTLPLFGLANTVTAAYDENRCTPTPHATCYPADCRPCFCLGPENYGANAPVCPKTCNGDFIISVAGFYWIAHQDGMEYAIDNKVSHSENLIGLVPINSLNNLIDAKYKTPDFGWEFGFKAGLAYCTTCDGWDIGVTWTWYRGKANSHIEAEADDNHTLISLWSGFASGAGSIAFASDIKTHWELQLNLIDIELGRDFWTSKYLAIRPHVGLRIAYINQDFEIQNKGGSWGRIITEQQVQEAQNNEIDFENDFKGVGIRAGLDSTWNFGCGWALYGNLAASIVYGKFHIEHDEDNRLASTPFSKTKILETEESFRASRGMLDLGLGIQWSTMFCNCSYGFIGMIGWEQHLFFNQNQLWRVIRVGDETLSAQVQNNTGENVYHQRSGTLDTQGWTLKFIFAF